MDSKSKIDIGFWIRHFYNRSLPIIYKSSVRSYLWNLPSGWPDGEFEFSSFWILLLTDSVLFLVGILEFSVLEELSLEQEQQHSRITRIANPTLTPITTTSVIFSNLSIPKLISKNYEIRRKVFYGTFMWLSKHFKILSTTLSRTHTASIAVFCLISRVEILLTLTKVLLSPLLSPCSTLKTPISNSNKIFPNIINLPWSQWKIKVHPREKFTV